MNKNELLTKLSERLEVTKKQVGEHIGVIDEIVDMVAEGEVNDKVKLGKGIVLEKVFVKGRSGVMKRKSITGELVETPYKTEDHYEVKVSGTQAMKNI